MAWVLRAVLPAEVCDLIVRHAAEGVVARCCVCAELLLQDVPSPAFDRSGHASFDTSRDGLHVFQAGGVLRFAPRVDPADVRPQALERDVLTLSSDAGQHTVQEDRLYRYVATPSGLYDNVPRVLCQARPFTRIGDRPFCMACVRAPRRAFDAWTARVRPRP